MQRTSAVRSKETEKEFSELVREDLLIWFCRHYGYPTDGFKPETVRRVSEHDAGWFLDALTTGTVAHDGACFRTPLGAAKERIFWQGRKAIAPRPLTVWVEPVITIEAASRLHGEFGWPKQLIGLQSHDGWAFDLIAYDGPGKPRIAAEIKKTDREIDYVIKAMTEFISRPPLDEQPRHHKRRNAYRKVVTLRRMGARLLWALGPSGYGRVFRVEFTGDHGTGNLERVDNRELLY